MQYEVSSILAPVFCRWIKKMNIQSRHGGKRPTSNFELGEMKKQVYGLKKRLLTYSLLFVYFHSTLDVRCSMLDVHLLKFCVL
jgi:hypothetical protein